MFHWSHGKASQTSSSLTAVTMPEDAGVKSVALSAYRCDWMQHAIDRLGHLCRLRRGWDGHNGLPANKSTALFASSVIGSLMLPNIPAPSIMPLSYGGIQVEWHRNGWDIEIEIAGPNQVFVYTRELTSGIEQEFSGGANLSRLRQIIDLIKT